MAEEYIGSRQVGSNGKNAPLKTLAFWSCLCDCGEYWETSGNDLRRGNTTQCGKCTPSGGEWDQDLTNRKFGNLKVVRRDGESSGRWQQSRKWLCECDCGEKKVFKASVLLQGRTSCGKECVLNLPANRGRLTALQFLRQDSRSRRVYLWSCSCGNKIESAYLGAKSCGCLSFEKLTKTFKDAAKRVQNQYQKDALKRKKDWNLTDEEFYDLIVSPCHYTGALPNKLIKTQQGDFLWNGVDRKDNTKGYVRGNVLPCSDHANWAKGTKPYDEFIIWLKQTAAFWKDKM